MKRRLAIQRMSLLLGGVVSASSLAAVLNGCKSPSDSAGSGSAFSFSTEEKPAIAELAEIIIPKTNTPGAKEVGVPEIMEVMLRDCYTEEQQKHFSAGLKTLEEESKKLGGNFASLDAQNKMKVVNILRDKATVEKEEEAQKAKIVDAETGKEKEEQKKSEPLTPFFTLFRDLTIMGYYTSEHGVTKEFVYSPVPGKFEGCIKVTPDQRAYS